MKKGLLLFTLFSFVASVFATDINSNITTNTTWNAAGSPYLIETNITVNVGVTLTIETGVTVQYFAGTRLTVEGTLNATGATFTASGSAPYTIGHWKGITSNVGGSVNLTDCIVQYNENLQSAGGTITLDGTDLLNFKYYGVYAEGIVSITDAEISTTSSWTSDALSGVYYNIGGQVSLDFVDISGVKSGIYSPNQSSGSQTFITNTNISGSTTGLHLSHHDTISANGLTISACDIPIKYTGSAQLHLTGTNNFTGNTHNYALVSFSSTPSDWDLPTLDIPYYFSSNFTYPGPGTMTIASNNTIKTNYGFTIDSDFIAEADAGEYIYFTSFTDDNWGGDSNDDGSATVPSPGSWNGLKFQNSLTGSLHRVKLRYAGSTSRGGISTLNSSPTIDECELNSNYYGIYMEGTSSPILTNNTIGSSNITPLAMSFEADPVMTDNVLSFSDNEYDAIGLLGGTLTADATISQRSFTGLDNITYYMLGEINVPDGITLAIDPGVVIKSNTASYNINVLGTLLAEGTVSEPIVFTSAKDDNFGNPGDTNKDGTTTTPTIGNFAGIVFSPTSSASSIMDYCIIKYASAANEYYYNTWMGGAAIVTANASPTIQNCEIKDVNYGINCFEASDPVISDNQMINVTYTPFAVSGSADPTFSGNTYLNVGWNALGLLGGSVSQDGTIRNRTVAGYEDITYILLNNMTIEDGTYVDVEPGVVIKLSNQSIYVKGGFKAVGTTVDKIVFTSVYDDNVGNPLDTNGDGSSTTPTAGNWHRVRFHESSDDAYCALDHCVFSYAGIHNTYTKYSILEFENASPNVSNTLVSQSQRYGLQIEGNSAPVFDGVEIQNCNMSPVVMSLTSDPQFSNMVFTANRDKGLALLEGTLSSDATLEVRDVAGIDNIAYIIDKTLTIGDNATLTLEPSIVMKSYSQSIYVDGALIADGNKDEKITFTAVADDSAGGDTNDDGNTTVPAAGNWSGLYFRSSGIDANNVLQNVNIRYSSRGISIASAYTMIDSCTIELVSGNAFEITGSADPDIQNNELYNINGAPVYLSMFSDPSFSDNSMANMGYHTFMVKPETYTQTATFPYRSFAGVDSITYHLNGTYTINDGTTITIPEGMVLETGKYISYYSRTTAAITVNGELVVAGTTDKPVVFKGFYNDNYGRPLDSGDDGDLYHDIRTGTWITFNNVSNDASTIDYAIFERAYVGIDLKSASPTISNSYFTDIGRGIKMSGVSEPTITGNTFHDLGGSSMSLSLVAYPALTENNIISGSTFKTIEVNQSETLTQDVTLESRDFGGIVNIPYLFNTYTIGTGAILSIDPGVVLKFASSGVMNVQKGLLVNGTSGASGTVVFTSIHDDFYGGDSNSNGDDTPSDQGYWQGIKFANTAIDASCVIQNAVIKNSDNYPALTATSSNPTISYTSFINAQDGVHIVGASDPVIDNCDFYDISRYAVNNVDKTYTIDATNNWWGDDSGPTHASNVDGIGAEVTDGVDFDPWLTVGANPVMGDVSLNGSIQAYDASLILQHAVSAITLDAAQVAVADVSGTAGVSAFDASLILQYTVGLIEYFDAELAKGAESGLEVSEVIMNIDGADLVPGEEITLPVRLSDVSGVYALQAEFNYDPKVLELLEAVSGEMLSGMNANINAKTGKVFFAAAGTSTLEQEGEMIYLTFKVAEEVIGTVESLIEVKKFLVNDLNLTADTKPAVLTVFGSPTGTESLSIKDSGLNSVYPNPMTSATNISYTLSEKQAVKLSIYNALGQEVITIVDDVQQPAAYTIVWDGTDYRGIAVEQGIYYIRIQTEELNQTRSIQVIH